MRIAARTEGYRAVGLEPAGEIDATISVASGCDNQPTPRAANALHGSDSTCLLLSSLDADLQEVIAAWDDIPQNIRNTVLTLAQSSMRHKK